MVFKYKNKETQNTYIDIVLPGFNKDEISINIENEQLIIKGYKEEKTENNNDYYKKTINIRNFEQRFEITTEIENINAKMENGILKIEIVPKVKNVISKKIEIN